MLPPSAENSIVPDITKWKYESSTQSFITHHEGREPIPQTTVFPGEEQLQVIIDKIPDTNYSARYTKSIIFMDSVYGRFNPSQVQELRSFYKSALVDNHIAAEEYDLLNTALAAKVLEQQHRMIPAVDSQRIKSFVGQISSYIDGGYLRQTTISSTSELAGIFAGVYKLHAHDPQLDKEMISRAMLALKAYTSGFAFGNIMERTDFIIEDFISREKAVRNTDPNSLGPSWTDFSIFLEQLLLATMPITDRDTELSSHENRLGTKKNAFEESRNKTREFSAAALEIVERDLERMGLSQARKPNIANNIFVQEIYKVPKFEHGPAREETGMLRSAKAPGGIAFDTSTDRYFDLPLTVQKAKTEVIATDRAKGRLGETKEYGSAVTEVHEALHTITAHDFQEQYERIFGEMLTDSCAQIVLIESRGGDFRDFERGNEFFNHPAYGGLVYFARDMLRLGVLEVDDIKKYAYLQNPKEFVQILASKISSSTMYAEIIKSLGVNNLLIPRLEDTIETLVEGLSTDPQSFLIEQFERGFNMLGNNYFAPVPGWYQGAILERVLEINPDYADRMTRLYKEAGINLPERRNNIELLKDPYTGLFTQEARRMIGTMFEDAGGSEKIYFKLLNDEFKLNPEQAQELADLMETDSAVSNTIAVYMAGIIGNQGNKVAPEDLEKISGETKDDKKLEYVMRFARNFIPNAIGILENNWTAQGIQFNNEDVLNLFRNLAEALGKVSLEKKYGPEELANWVADIIDALTSPTFHEGKPVYPGKNQVMFAARALSIDESPRI